MLSMRKFTKKVLLAAVLAASTLSGASMALPVPPAGSVLLVEYYDAFGNQVGAQVHGDCPDGPTPLTWGVRTSNRELVMVQCWSSLD